MSIRRFCENSEHDLAPRDGCGCRECYRIRSERLPRALVALIDIGPFAEISRVSGTIAYRLITMHCAGHATYEDMMVALVKALAEECDRLSKIVMDQAMLKPILTPGEVSR